ncbi:hypothetical protein BASA50_001357 [Batrachochytrium salamandrivorans]|uniref:Uncharacterized protein n=1 Tax=Batrachochytrium salamandrivorans TaxID=1357716 RepID=A0ABQ8EY98_9FUNG|nr:hypothetical protein BASA61_007922 [Batrachochytrium salamandrivorans]KAH6587224.1 hypothetical protein BASA50_001357 [Batrachochytrium salamandrivorans]
MIGKVFQIGLDITLVAALASGAQRAAGIELNQKKIENETARTVAAAYLRYGDWVIDTAANQLRSYPDWFPKK